ncbi:MAG: antibiotic biosynthesis monooxygenase [Betaproteobacteria bacterium]|jgi:heme-degrading monooxygenase HmoA|nr:antibiotic biosynthesis monooxygenase [Betaproteobacteria bacterium]
MYFATVSFRIARGHEQTFLNHWRSRTSYLGEVPGFIRFCLLQGQQTEEYTLFVAHTEWENKELFEAWTRSEAFRKAHVDATKIACEICLGLPKLELFDLVL